jgi:hypothetical protein
MDLRRVKMEGDGSLFMQVPGTLGNSKENDEAGSP